MKLRSRVGLPHSQIAILVAEAYQCVSTVLLQAMKQDPPMDLKCRDKFLVQSVLISSDLEFSNVQTIVCRDLPTPGEQQVLAQTLTPHATTVGVRGEVSGSGEEDKSQLPPCWWRRALRCCGYSHQAATPHQRRKSPSLISNPTAFPPAGLSQAHTVPIGRTDSSARILLARRAPTD